MTELNNLLDFPVDFRVGSQLTEKKIIVSIRFNSPLTVDNRERLKYILDCIIIVGNNGMFCTQKSSPIRSSLKKLSTSDTGEREIIWHITLKEIDQIFFKILIGLIQYYSYYTTAVNQLTVTSELSSDEKLLSLKKILSEKNNYLVCSSPSFKVEREEPDRPDKNRVIQIEFVNELQENNLDNIFNILYAWDTVCLGGFPKTGRTSKESGISPGEAYLIDAYTIEHIVNLFEVSEDALNAVINMSAFFHITYSPIHKVLIS